MVQLLVLLLVLVLVVLPLWAILRIVAYGRQNDAIAQQLAALEAQLQDLRARLATLTPPPARPPVPADSPQPAAVAVPVPAAPPTQPVVALPPAIAARQPVTLSPASPSPPPLPAAAVPPPSAQPASVAAPPTAPEPPREPVVNWEQFMGAKLFAWLGGLAAFLGAVFFVKYSFEHDLIPPGVRVALGYAFAIALVGGGLKINRQRYSTTVQTLCATGIVVLYAVTFAGNAVYRFPLFGLITTFLLMSLITAAAFVLAVRLDARVVAILGMVGGFLTPLLLSSGRDNPVGLFGYIALLDIGLIAVAVHRGWSFLVALGTGGTIVMQAAWAARFLQPSKATTAMVICLSFCALFLAAYFVARRLLSNRREQPAHPVAAVRGASVVPVTITWSVLTFPLVAFCFAIQFLGYVDVSTRPGLLFSYVLLADACVLVVAWIDENVPSVHLGAGLAVFALLAAWTSHHLTLPLMGWALGLYLVFAILHSGFPLLLERRQPAAAPTWWSQLFPPLALLLMLGPVLKLDPVPAGVWPFILLIDLLAIGLALLTAMVAVVVAVLVLTLAATALWLLQAPAAAPPGSGEFILVIGGFAVLFFAAGLFLHRRVGDQLPDTIGDARGGSHAQLPALAAVLPFVLLIMMVVRLRPENPSAVYALALVLVGMTLGLTRLLVRPGAPAKTAIAWLPACALAGVVALELAWLAEFPTPANPAGALGWLVLFTAVFAVYPFVFRRTFAALTGPWAVAATAGILQFLLVYRLVARVWPNDYMGVVPALFAVPPLLSLAAIRRAAAVEPAARLNLLAWYGGAALLFITLIVPIQFERQWITIGWALEGVALLWLFQRVPHSGLRVLGVVLLLAAFVRLALNPAVLAYHARAATPIFNWYLYAYGIAIVALFAGAWFLRRTDNPANPWPTGTVGVSGAALLNALGVVLAFVLMNIEIADYFSPPAARVLTFEFSGSFARDMSYTIGWALFALALLLTGIWRRTRAGRYAALALLGTALLKLFLHDLARLEALYRIGALFALAVIAIGASVAYQRFLPAGDEDSEQR